MPRIMAKVEGKGNGIKTVIANMSDIAKALARPPTYPTKYFGCELGAQTNFDLKNDRYIVNGEHDASKLQDILDGFIRKFVLCPACDNPETTLTVKRQVIHAKCKACGHAFQIDPKQKLSTFILKNPPPPEETAENKEKHDGSGSPAGEEEATEEQTVQENGSGNDEDDDEWAPEPMEDPEKLSTQIGKLVLDKDLDKPENDRLDMLEQFFIKAKKDGTIQDSKAMVNEAERLEMRTKAVVVLANIIFDEDVINQIKSHRTLLLRFCLNDKKAQRYLLGGIEHVIYDNKDILLPKTAHIMKALYDADIVEEETLLNWGSKPSGKYVKKDFAKELIKIAQPVLKWLEEAEEDTESDEDEDVAFDDRARNVGTIITDDENGEEIDIDDI
ncbi:domain found in IF2B/IF5 domain-containing protein [Ditylenchus destructor]|uniref:Eukaryotic translation initiation factor 5 n=1 Tax=Ditylenchus destructor TaxID=166010 RepID=A0AAD4RA29_9BILA|nr:domain found in IF2B/IF5 domain-containing protein [Ditylenchus destructor]